MEIRFENYVCKMVLNAQVFDELSQAQRRPRDVQGGGVQRLFHGRVLAAQNGHLHTHTHTSISFFSNSQTSRGTSRGTTSKGATCCSEEPSRSRMKVTLRLWLSSSGFCISSMWHSGGTCSKTTSTPKPVDDEESFI